MAKYRVGEHRLAKGLLLPSVNLQHDLNGEVMLYGYLSRGAKSGGYDSPCYFGGPVDNEDAGVCHLAGRENQQTPKWSNGGCGFPQRPFRIR